MISTDSVALAPVFGIFSIFLFVLLVIILVKKPKVGAWLVSAVILLPLLFFVLTGVRLHGIAPIAPVLGIGGCFAFVLLLMLLHHRPKVAIGLLVAMIVAFGAMFFSYQSVRVPSPQPTVHRQNTQRSYGPPHPDKVYEDFARATSASSPDVSYVEVGRPSSSVAPVSSDVSYADAGQPAVTAPIWSEGVEDQYEADIYPSKTAAVSALGPKLKDWVQQVSVEANEPIEIVLFQEDHNRSIVWRFERAIEEALPGIACSIESGSRNINWNEIGVTLQFEVTMSQTPSWETHSPALQEHVPPRLMMDNGRAVAKARCRERETTVTQSFIEKPWADDFSSFINERSDRHFLIARSQGACTSENEAKRQAEADACRQLNQRLAETFPRSFPKQPIPALTPSNLRERGFVVDQFLQSFDGMSGRLWRQALLIDVGAEKMARLEGDTHVVMQVERRTWAHMIVSSIGALLVIVLSYLFLNMATRGYYVWSLRIAGFVLAVVGILSIILVLR